MIGDWGAELDHHRMFDDQKRVAEAMRRHALAEKPEFVLSVGDQAYTSGVSSLAEANSRFAAGFDSIYDNQLLKKWYLTLGNHDCEGNVSAAYEFAEAHPRWTMKPFYRHTTQLPDGTRLSMFVLDMCTFVCSASGDPNRRCAGPRPAARC